MVSVRFARQLFMFTTSHLKYVLLWQAPAFSFVAILAAVLPAAAPAAALRARWFRWDAYVKIESLGGIEN